MDINRYREADINKKNLFGLSQAISDQIVPFFTQAKKDMIDNLCNSITKMENQTLDDWVVDAFNNGKYTNELITLEDTISVVGGVAQFEASISKIDKKTNFRFAGFVSKIANEIHIISFDLPGVPTEQVITNAFIQAFNVKPRTRHQSNASNLEYLVDNLTKIIFTDPSRSWEPVERAYKDRLTEFGLKKVDVMIIPGARDDKTKVIIKAENPLLNLEE